MSRCSSGNSVDESAVMFTFPYLPFLQPFGILAVEHYISLIKPLLSKHYP
jgi:hypothetical protein